jgi:hypothetical protein
VNTFDAYREIVAVDFEFTALSGERPSPVCLVAHELRSGRRFRVFQDIRTGATVRDREGRPVRRLLRIC